MSVQFYKSGDNVTAYKQNLTDSSFGMFLLSGHRTTFDSYKREFIGELCQEHDISFTHFTYFGWDQSHAQNVPELGQGYVQDWLAQAIDLLDAQTSGPQIIIGSSMGGYMALALAQARPDRVKAIVGLAAGFGSSLREQVKEHYGEYRVGTVEEKGFVYSINPDGSLPIQGKLDITCPVRLLHSLNDDTVNYRNTEYIANAVMTDDVMISLTKYGSHRQNSPEEMSGLRNTLISLL